ncbi:methionyl-tRNA formyltransferase [Sphingorhabdus lutea]|uniref:Methionyl-tRNA formyltransferase n=1 Tax=Sphingorhabdus lutea TaxID=1913578 RepID=A0A1L3JBI1_9SPHN|nr:methionyl-tRNA formyltransferase [Sphingorhabdus lutea]APG62459.1 methionyl-tRNA formyltransferase [Sphingorhabdus lutea]
MRIAFMGTPDFAIPALNKLVADGHEIVAVYSQPPRPANRGKKLQKTPVHVRADELGLDVRHPLNFKDAADIADFSALNLDMAVVAAYGLILPQSLLDAPKYGCINIHGSLLPRWRGAAPVQRAILAGDEKSGAAIMQMEAGLDTGPVFLTKEMNLRHNDGSWKNAGHITDEIAHLGAEALSDFIDNIDNLTAIAQAEDGVTYAHKIKKEEALLDFSKPAEILAREIAAFDPAPASYFILGDDRIRLFNAHIINASGQAGEILDADMTIACGELAIRADFVQRAGRPKLSRKDFLNGTKLPKGTILS